VICDVINTQNNPDVKRGLQKLQKKETQLKTDKTVIVLWADKQKKDQCSMNQNCSSLNYCTANIKQHYCRSFSSDSDHSSHHFIKYFLCNSSHFIKDCEFLPDVKWDAQRRQAGQLQSSYTGWLQSSCIRSQSTKKKKRDTESLMQKSVTVMMMTSSLNLMRKRKSAMKLLLCLRRLSVRCSNLNELQILNSSYT